MIYRVAVRVPLPGVGCLLLTVALRVSRLSLRSQPRHSRCTLLMLSLRDGRSEMHLESCLDVGVRSSELFPYSNSIRAARHYYVLITAVDPIELMY